MNFRVESANFVPHGNELLHDAKRIVSPAVVDERAKIAERYVDGGVGQLRSEPNRLVVSWCAGHRQPAIDRGGENNALVVVRVISEDFDPPRRISRNWNHSKRLRIAWVDRHAGLCCTRLPGPPAAVHIATILAWPNKDG